MGGFGTIRDPGQTRAGQWTGTASGNAAALAAERFKLAVICETEELAIYGW